VGHTQPRQALVALVALPAVAGEVAALHRTARRLAPAVKAVVATLSSSSSFKVSRSGDYPSLD